MRTKARTRRVRACCTSPYAGRCSVRSTLTRREADVLRRHFGVNGYAAQTLEEVGEQFGLTRERVRQIKEKAIRRLKHTSRSQSLKSYLG
jgi:RNA polymerase primary sigma factor